jgi:hypothetical protein
VLCLYRSDNALWGTVQHRACDDLDAGVERPVVWLACDCGAANRLPLTKAPHLT